MNLLALLFAIAISVWVAPLLKDGRLIRGLAMLLIVGTVFGPPFFAIDGPVQISLDRLLWVALTLTAMVHWRLGKTTPLTPTRIDWCLLVLTAYLLLRSRGGNVAEAHVDPTGRWLFYIFLPVATYFIGRLARIRQRDFDWFLNALIGLGVYLSFTAVCEMTGLHALVFPKFMLDPNLWEFYGRGRGPLLNPVGNGFVMGIALAAVCARFVGADRRGKAVALALGLILMLGGYATLTRSVWLGLLAAVIVVAFIHVPRWTRVLGLVTGVLIAGLLMTGLKDDLLAMKRDKALSAADAAKSVELRPLLATVAWEMFKDRPLTGHGFGQYFQHHDSYHTIRRYGLPLEQARDYGHHNTFLAFLVDSGLVGLALFLAVLAGLAAGGWRMAHDREAPLARRRIGLFTLAVLAAYLPNALFHDMTIIPMVQMFLLATAGPLMTIAGNGFQADEPLSTGQAPASRSTPRLESSPL
ncbi:O-antigen ligase family protein [Roseiconus nitratireducens]|uniref:O-antigen ligase family protein n=1 Tax=Roseiconus nitratireducens TaxID=2605748 RepID=A0A5M6D3N7_9BACT|nr:O-antigen ligase family protein [Roseiconus nitratireducens]KAA5542094.1 O-antigen ligase family protein [Roseiconus nitratireducens]